MEEGRSKLKCKSVKERKICGEGEETRKGILLHRRRENICSEGRGDENLIFHRNKLIDA